MSVEVIIIEDAYDPKGWTLYEGDNALELIKRHYQAFPENGRIYHNEIAQSNDVTPYDGDSEKALETLDGHVYVVTAPGDPVTIFVAAIAIFAAAASIYIALNLPQPTQRNTQSQSPNNALSTRTNQARPNARIPDVFGAIRSTPDLIMRPYTVYESHQEIEYNYMCIGRGSFAIDTGEVKDGDTPLSQISGSSAEFYSPFASPISGTPFLTIGGAISEPIYTVFQSNAVNGQTLKAPNDKNIVGRTDISSVAGTSDGFVSAQGATHVFTDEFTAGDSVDVVDDDFTGAGGGLVFTTYNVIFNDADDTITFQTAGDGADFTAGQTITISGATYFRSNNAFPEPEIIEYSIDGTYDILSVAGDVVTLDNPSSVNSYWSSGYGATYAKDVQIGSGAGATTYNVSGTYTVDTVTATTLSVSGGFGTDIRNAIINLFSGTRPPSSPRIFRSQNNWEGPFVINKEVDAISLNIVARQGMFKDDGEAQISTSVTCTIEYSLIDINGTVTSGPFLQTATVIGSKDTRDLRAVTSKINLPSRSRVSVRVRRDTPQDLFFEGSVVDEVKLERLFGLQSVDVTDFGNVTTVHTKTIGTEAATAVKERKFNCEVAREIPLRISGESFTAPTATTYAADIIIAISTDPQIGNIPLSDMDLDGIYGALNRVVDYFGDTDAAAFSYTFDSDQLSLQDMVQTVCQAVFCQAYRQANKLRVTEILETEDSHLLFNHRNKIPGTEKINDRFGPREDIDGVELEWVDPVDDALVKRYIPADQSALKPNKIETVGVRNNLQSYYHAWREYNRILYENGTTEFTATQEAELLPRSARFISADNTRILVQDGEIIAQNGLTVTTSQDVTFEAGKSYTAFIQLPDGTVDAIDVIAGATEREMVLSRAPLVPLSTSIENYARATYILSADDDYGKVRPYRLTQTSASGDLTVSVEGSLYTPLIHQFDAVILRIEDGPIDMGPLQYVLTGPSVTDGARGDVIAIDGSANWQVFSGIGASIGYSFAFFINRTGSGNIFARNGGGHVISVDGSGVITVDHDGATLTAGTVTASQWASVFITHENDGQTSIYINGVVAGSDDIGNPDYSGSLVIGSAGLDSTRLDDLRYYARPITPSGVKAIYNILK